MFSQYKGTHRPCRYSPIPGGIVTVIVGATVLTFTLGSAGVSATVNHPPAAEASSTIHPGPVSSLFRYTGAEVSRSVQRAELAPDSVEILPVPAVADPSNWQQRQDLRVAREVAASQAKVQRLAKAAAAKAAAAESDRQAARARADRKTTIAAAKVEAAAKATKAVERKKAARRATLGISGPYVPPAAGIKSWTAQQVTALGYTPEQFTCLDLLWTRESGWNVLATNAKSGAYGIPQSLPAAKMASTGKDWLTNPKTQITWGLGYVKGRYGDACHAWAHSEEFNWY